MKIDVNKSKPGIEVEIDRKKSGSLGVYAGQIGQQLRNSLFGAKAGVYKKNGEDYDINVRFEEKYRKNSESLLDQYIVFRPIKWENQEVPISATVKLKNANSFSAIKHKDLSRVVTVYSPILAGYNANEVFLNVKKAIETGFEGFKNNVSYSFTGEIAEQEKNMSFLVSALFTALGLILFLLVLQFNSISNPLIILLSIFLSFTGVLYGISIFNMPFVIMMTMMGIISLSGIVVNNGVVLIDYTNLLVERKKLDLGIEADKPLQIEDFKNSVISGGAARLRPVLLTAITTILGLIPLATGLNINFFSLVSEWNPNFLLEVIQLYFGVHYVGPLFLD